MAKRPAVNKFYGLREKMAERYNTDLDQNDRKSYRRVADRLSESGDIEPGVSGAMVRLIINGHEPHKASVREALHLPPVGVGVLCARHGRVCAVQHRPPKPASEKRPRPGWGRKPLNTIWPVNTSEW